MTESAGQTAGRRIIEALKEAQRGDFASVMVDGVTWHRTDLDAKAVIVKACRNRMKGDYGHDLPEADFYIDAEEILQELNDAGFDVVRRGQSASDMQEVMRINNAMRDLLNEALTTKAGTKALELSCPRWGERVRKVVAP